MSKYELRFQNVVSLHCDSERESHTDLTDLTDSLLVASNGYSHQASPKELRKE